MASDRQPRVTGPRVTGLGGVFYVVKDPAATRAWYRDVLGVDGEYGPQFDWAEEPRAHPYSLISHFADDSYIRPGTGGFMINLRVDDLDLFLEQNVLLEGALERDELVAARSEVEEVREPAQQAGVVQLLDHLLAESVALERSAARAHQRATDDLRTAPVHVRATPELAFLHEGRGAVGACARHGKGCAPLPDHAAANRTRHT